MSYYEDQENAWYANNCKGKIEDYGPEEIDEYLLNEKEEESPDHQQTSSQASEDQS